MNLRYVGFEQHANARAYCFDWIEKGQPTRRCVVTADLALFLTHGVALQEGPTLCATKLTADLTQNLDCDIHELTAADLRLHADSLRLAAEVRAQKRSTRRPHTPPKPNSPWRNSGL